MDFKKLKEACIKAGIKEVEVYKVESKETSINTFNQVVDKNEVCFTNELYVRGVYNSHIAALKIERDDDSEIDLIVKLLKDNASIIESNDPYFIYEGSDSYLEVMEDEHDYDEYSLADKIAFCQRLEQFCKDKSEYVMTTQAQLAVEERRISIENSKGLSLKRGNKIAMCGCVAVIRKDNDVKQGYFFDVVKNFKDFDFDKLYKKAVERPLSAIGAASVASAKYPVVFENSAACSLLSCFLSMFSGEAVIKKLSLLKDKLNEKVFGDNITIYDDPLYEDAVSKPTFDDEGVATKKKALIENGVLKTFLHNLKTAKMLNTESTGNGFKTGDGNISVSPTNMVVKSTDVSFDEMIKDIDNGILITQMMGQHAGVNAVSGAFNLQSSGYKIENGKITAPITLFIVSGNIIDLLNNVVNISNDYERSGKLSCGSMYIKELNISGK